MNDGIAALVVVSQELFGNGLKSILCKYPNRLRAHVSTSIGDALEVLEAHPGTRLTIIDIDAPGVAGAATIALLRDRFPSMRIVLAAPQSGRSQILACLGWGVHGVVLRTQSAREIIGAVRVVMDGGIFVPPSVCEAEAAGAPDAIRPAAPADLLRHGNRSIALAAANEPPHGWAGSHLSARQSAVLMLLVRGFSNKAIARELGIAEGTVKVHLAALYKALQVRNRASAVATMATTGRFALPAAVPMMARR
jgi:DNA-binding NarL/FixJ family response regulator